MAERKSISQSMPSAAFDFIKQGIGAPVTEKPVRQVSGLSPTSGETVKADRPARKSSAQKRKPSRSRPDTARLSVRVALTTRLTPELIRRLQKEAFHRKLEGFAPDTIQLILEEAAELWLERNSLLDDE